MTEMQGVGNIPILPCAGVLFSTAGQANLVSQQRRHVMERFNKKIKVASITVLLLLTAACSSMERMEKKMSGGITERSTDPLTGAQEVPPVSTTASGRSPSAVASDRTVSGSVIITGMNATAAHIHHGAKGTNGPVIVPLTKTSATTFAVPAGAKLTDAQYAAYKTGDLYVNVHSAAHPDGEIRLQLNP
jgi:hypothetical protein